MSARSPSRGLSDSGRARDRGAAAGAAAHTRGAALFITFLLMLIFAGLAAAIGIFAHNSQWTGKSALLDKQAYYIAEAGWQRARQALVAGTWAAAASPGNSYTESFGTGEYAVAIVDNGGGKYTITSAGYVGNATTYAARRQLVEDELSVTASNGTNKSLTATASASSTNGSNAASKAKDDDTGTKWRANTNGSGQWLKMDHGSATTLDKIVILEDDNINGVTVERSSDNSSWTTASGLSVIESPSKTWTCAFTEASYQYWRATFTASGSSDKVAVKEMQDYDSSISSLGAGTVSTAW